MEWHLCAPGPSMSQELVDGLKGKRVGVVGRVFELAPWADVLVANDEEWWVKYPEAFAFKGRKFSANRIAGVEVCEPGASNLNSGTLALQALSNLGATTIYLHGFDHHGSHYFGPYDNGLVNTPDHARLIHLRQFQGWAAMNRHVNVVNCTKGSALDCFPFAEAACI